MQIYSNSILEVKPDFCVYLAFLVVLMPIKLVVAWLAAAVVHELSHYVSLLLFRINVVRFTLGYRGAIMRTEALQPWQELICALAGPIGGLALLLFRRWIPFVAACGLVQSTFNLLPFYPLDGGRIVKAFAELFIFLLAKKRNK